MITEAIRNGPAFSFMLLGLIIIFGPWLAERLHLPGLLGLLIGGALVGPNVLDILNDFTGLENVGQIGVLYLIFLAGLQMDIETFRRFWRISGAFGLITAVIPHALGTLITLRLGYGLKAAILIGSFWASFTLIAYPVLKQFELTKNRAGAAVLGASAITDTISLLVLALVAGSETGDQSGFNLILAIIAGLALLGVWCMFVLPWIAQRFFSTLGRGRMMRFMLVLVGLTSAAVVAEIVGIEPLLGAFFAGLGLNRLVPNESALMEYVDFFGNALFIPAFLVSVGFLFDPGVMLQRSTISLAVSLSIALVAGKAVAAWITGRMFHLTGAETGVLFTVSVAQAAATLAATIIGFELGLYGDEVVNAVMVVIGVSMIITSLGTPTYSARVEQPEEEERRLGEVILVPTRHPGEDLDARLRFAGLIAHNSGGLLVPLVVALPEDGQDLSEARAQLAGIDDALHALGFEGDGRLRIDRSLAEGISGAAIESNASLVLLRWPGPQPFTHYFAESLSSEVSRLVECPVAIAAVLESPPERVFLAVSKYDLAPSRVDGLRAAVDLATAAASNHQLIVGPTDPELLVKAGMTLPAWTEYHAGESELFKWVEQNSNEHDLIVAVFRSRFGSRTITDLHNFNRSVVTVMASRGSAGSRAIR